MGDGLEKKKKEQGDAEEQTEQVKKGGQGEGGDRKGSQHEENSDEALPSFYPPVIKAVEEVCVYGGKKVNPSPFS